MFEISEYYELLEQVQTCKKSIKLVKTCINLLELEPKKSFIERFWIHFESC